MNIWNTDLQMYFCYFVSERVRLRCCLSLIPIRFCSSEEGKGCRIFRVRNINSVLLYFAKLYMKSVV